MWCPCVVGAIVHSPTGSGVPRYPLAVRGLPRRSDGVKSSFSKRGSMENNVTPKSRGNESLPLEVSPPKSNANDDDKHTLSDLSAAQKQGVLPDSTPQVQGGYLIATWTVAS